MMLALLRVALTIAVVAMFGLRSAHADIYTFLDASGGLNVSNLAPPDDARVLKIVHTDDAAREAQRKTETQALADRVKQLEDEVEAAKRDAPPPMPYVPPPVAYAPPAPPVVQYIVEQAPPVVQYVNDSPAPYTGGCDPSWYGCSYGWWPGFYPSSVVVVTAGPFRPFKPGFGRGFRPHPSPVRHPPMQTSLIQPLAVPLIQPLVPTQAPAMRTPGFHRG